MFKLTLNRHFLVEMDFSYEKIAHKEKRISVSTNAEVLCKQDAPAKEFDLFVRIIAKFKNSVQNNNEEIFSFIYGFDVVAHSNTELPVKEITDSKKFEDYITNELYPEVQNFLRQFYNCGNIEFATLPPID